MKSTFRDGATYLLNVVVAQGNAAGGAVKMDLSPGAGNEFEIGPGRATNSGTNGLQWVIREATGNAHITFLSSIASGAGVSSALPQSVASSSTTTLLSDSTDIDVVSGTDYLTIEQTLAGLQNDTLTVLLTVRLRSPAGPSGLVATTARSTNPGNVTVSSGSLTAVPR